MITKDTKVGDIITNHYGEGGEVMDNRDCVEMLELLFDEYDEMDRLNPSVLFLHRYSEIMKLMLKGGNNV